MAERLDDSESWLPAEFLDEDFFLEESRAVAKYLGNNKAGFFSVNPRSSPSDTTTEAESDEDYIAGLSRQMAQYTLHNDRLSSVSNPKMMATSPQSTLCDDGIWSVSSRRSPNGPSQMSSPPSTPLDHMNNDAWDLLYEAAREVLRMQRNRQSLPGRGLVNLPKNPSLKSSCGFHNNPILYHQQFQAAQLYQLKQQQLIKKQLSAAWSRQNAALTEKNCRPHGVASSGCPIVQWPQPGARMRAVFLNNHGIRRESAGTGVFLPRRAATIQESRRKPASTVLLPAKVVQALNLNVDDMREVHPRYPGFYALDREMVSARGNQILSSQRRRPNQTSQPPVGHELLLPPEWTD